MQKTIVGRNVKTRQCFAEGASVQGPRSHWARGARAHPLFFKDRSKNFHKCEIFNFSFKQIDDNEEKQLVQKQPK